MNVLCVVDHLVMGVTQLHDVVYVVCFESFSILRFNATTHQQLTEIIVDDLRAPRDIVACQQTSQLYVVDWPRSEHRCIWRVSTDGTDIKRWLPKSPSDTFNPVSLSVTSTDLLVTSHDPHQLIQFDSVGCELRRVRLGGMVPMRAVKPLFRRSKRPLKQFDSVGDELLLGNMEPQHAVASSTRTFVVSLFNTQLKQGQVVVVNNVGEVLRKLTDSRLSSLGLTPRVAVDSRGNIFLANYLPGRILLLDSQLNLRHTIIDKQLSFTSPINHHQPFYEGPLRLCYNEQSGQLLVGLFVGHVVVFDVLSWA